MRNKMHLIINEQSASERTNLFSLLFMDKQIFQFEEKFTLFSNIGNLASGYILDIWIHKYLNHLWDNYSNGFVKKKSIVLFTKE